MKYSTRSAAALVTTGLLAGGGLVAAVTGLAQDSSVSTGGAASQARHLDTSADPALSAAVRDMLRRGQTMHARLLVTRHQLSQLNKRLEHQHELVQTPGRLPGEAVRPAGWAPQGQAGYPAVAPSVHTSTGASGSTSPSSSRPSTHTTTGASGSTATAGRPLTHTTTGASGSTTGGQRESEHEDGGRDD